MISISLCMIVKNEAEIISRCLNSIHHLVDEINIIDTGSTDKTKEIVSQYTDRIFDFKWIDDFSAARNFAFSKATKQYILWLDADDVLLEKDQEKLLTLKKSLDPTIDSVTMDYHLAFDEYGKVTFKSKRNRLVKRDNHYRWIGAVHEYLAIAGNIYHSDVAITHRPTKDSSDRNLKIYEKQLAKGEIFTHRDLYYFANELTDHGQYERAIQFYEKFLTMKEGWIEDNLSACGKLTDCYLALDQPDQALQSIFRSFTYDHPRPEFCCRLGDHFLQRENYELATFWYHLATEKSLLKKDHMGFVNLAYTTWYPHLQLCVCYDRLGHYEKSYTHNEIARKYRPEDRQVLHNKQYLEPIIQQEKLSQDADHWLKLAKKVDENFSKKSGKQKLNITILMNHMQVCGAVRIILEYTNKLINRGHTVTIIGYDPEPEWIRTKAQYIKVPAGKTMIDMIGATDLMITTVWDQMLPAYLSQKAPIIHYEHGDIYHFEMDEYDAATKSIWQQRFSIPVPILTVSSGLAKLFHKNFQRQPQALPNAINEDIFFPRKDDKSRNATPRILFVGPEQWPFKGIVDILQALEIVQQQGFKIEPVWVTQTTPTRAFDGTLHVNPPQKKLGVIYRTADIYVCGSLFESFALPPLEAMTSGCAVVSTKNIGVLEYGVHRENCLLAEINDPDSLSRNIIELLTDQKLHNHLVKKGYETAEKFKPEPIINRFEQYMYHQIANWKNDHKNRIHP